MNIKEFLESKPKAGMKVFVQVPAEVRDTEGDTYLHSSEGDYWSDGVLSEYEVIIPKPELPTKLGAVIDHSEYGKCILADDDGAPWRCMLEAEWRSRESLTATGTFTILSEGVDE